MSTNSYVIFVGQTTDDLQPVESAPDQESAICRAVELQNAFPCVEAVYMPEEDLDINEIVYSHK